MACCGGSAALGVRVGMTIAHATALVPPEKLLVEDHQPADDLAALKTLARWAMRFSPIVAPDPPDGLLIDATGCQRLYGSDVRMAALVTKSIRRLRVSVRAAVAPTVGGAWALARFATTSQRLSLVMGPHELRDALLPLPLAALRLDSQVTSELAEVGIDCIGQLLDVPRDGIAGRFGADVLLRIDQALGDAMEILSPLRPEPVASAVIRFSGPTTQVESIELAIRGLIDDLAAQLLRRESGARRLILDIERLDATLRLQSAQESVTFSRPSRDVKHLWAVLRPHVERLHLGNGVERIALIAKRCGALPHEQERLCGEDATADSAAFETAAGELVDLLRGRLGSEAVLRCEPHDTHVPEAAFRFLPASEAGLFQLEMPAPTGDATRGDRPTVLFDRPEPAKVMLLEPEGPVISLQWRGQLHRIITAIGPERIGRRWWQFAPSSCQPARDYYKLQDDVGLWLWTYRSLATRRWFVQGVWG